MTDYQALKKILRLATVTVNKKNAYIDYYNKINYSIVSILILLDIIEKESGNFDTGDNHYRLNEKFISVGDKITISFKKIEEALMNDKVYHFKQIQDLKCIFDKVKIDLQRKIKLENLNKL